MIKCYFCDRELKTKSAYISHLRFRKKSCIDDCEVWNSKKNEILSDFLNKYITFDINQLKFINSPLIDCKLLGIPGGGKTRCIIEKIKKCFNDKILNTNTDFLILTFSKRSRFDFLNKGKILCKFFNQKNVRTLHSIAGYIMSEISNRKSTSLETVVLAALKLITEENINLKTLKLFFNLKVIFVDEAQDISLNQYKFICKLKEKLDCKLILVGDPNQNIYQFQGGSDKYLLEYKVPSFKLLVNYRSNKDIVSFVSGISPHKTKMISKNKVNNKVEIFEGTLDEIENDIVNQLKNTKIDLSKVAVIGPVKRCNVKHNTYLNLGLSLIANALSKNNIPFLKQYTDTHNMKFDSEKLKTIPNHVNLFTIHGSKGLEFEKVYLLNYHFTTFGKMPTINDYNIFKYMWYVGTSRPKNFLKIYKDNTKKIWPLTLNVDNNVYKMNKQITFMKKIKFENEMKQLRFCVTDFLEELKAEELFRFETKFKFDVEEQVFFKMRKNLADYKNLAIFYGNFIETIFEYYYYYFEDNIPEDNFLNRIIYQFSNTLIINKGMVNCVKKLFKRLNLDLNSVLSLNLFEKFKYEFSKDEIYFYDFLKEELKNNFNKKFFISFENKVTKQNNKNIVKICKKILNNYKEEDIDSIFKIILYKYQLNNESGYLLNNDFSDHIEKISPIIKKIRIFCENKKYQNLKFQYSTEHSHFPISGIIDCVDFVNKKIIDIKFTKSFHIRQAFQLLMYYNNLIPDWKEKFDLEIINFYTGKVYKIKFDEDIKNYDLLKLLVDTTDVKLKNTLFCYDLETTGLNIEKLEVIERYFEEYNLGYVPSSGLIKPFFKISSEITNITKITNKMLENGDNKKKFKNELRNIFNYCDNPKFMAHNGYVFDHRILFKSLSPSQLLDSRFIIRMLNDVDTHKMKLGNIYELILKKKPENCHRAKDDVKMMIEILKHLKYEY
jgi:DNA polymerase III epsilon subunit-like protein